MNREVSKTRRLPVQKKLPAKKSKTKERESKPGEKRSFAGKKKKLSYFDEEFGLFKPESIESGKRIIAEHKELFERLESFYGIPANYIVAIIRVETNFKQHLGEYRVFNSLYTMAMLRTEMPRRIRGMRPTEITYILDKIRLAPILL